MENLKECQSLTVRQKREAIEVFTAFEMCNRYEVFTADGRQLYLAEEVRGSSLARNFLRSQRSFTIEVTGPDNQLAMRVFRPFTFFFHKVDVQDPQGVNLGYAQKQLSFLKRIYHVFDQNGDKIFELIGPVLKPWTLFIEKDGQQLGKLVRRWGGLAKEMVTQEDNYDVHFSVSIDVKQKALLLAAVFLIDFVQFERKGKR